MTVDEFADALTNPGLEPVEHSEYQNQYGQRGYRAIYRDSERFLWFSVSGTSCDCG